MDHITTITHIRKPVLISMASIFFILFIHLIGVYIYMGGHYVGLPGGSTSIAIVGAAPDMMSPLAYGKNPSDEILYRFLYRGLIRYNPEDNTAQEDLAKCDLSNIEKITCILNQGNQWSDGTEVKSGDVIATFRAFGELGENQAMNEVLRDTRIELKNDTITFLNPDKDTNILKLLAYPIYRSDIVEQAKTGRFGTGSHITTGQYTYTETVEDTEYVHSRITLTKNEKTSKQKAWFDKIHFKFFENTTTLKNAEDTLGIIIPTKENQEIILSDRFRGYQYTTHEYFGVFFQTDRINRDIRNSLHWQIGGAFSGQIEGGHRPIANIFYGKPQILPTNITGNFSDIMRKNGYMKRDDWLNSIESTPTTITGTVQYDIPKFFKNRQNSKVLFINNASGGILLSGIMDSVVTSVVINGYQLQEFRPGNKNFSYRVSREDNTLIEGKNTYLLEGKIGATETTTGEILTIYYTPDEQKMAEYKNAVDSEYRARNNTPALIAEREREKTKQIEFASTLDPLYYYNKEGQAFTITVAYITGKESTESYAKIIKDSLRKLSIMTELAPLEPKGLQDMIVNGKKEYDILIAGVSAGETISDIGQLFDPSKAGKGINLSNIEIPKLVTLFGDLRSATISEKRENIINDILKIMAEESFFFPISSPIHTLYIDRNLKGVRELPVISGPKSIYDIVEFASIKDTYIFDTESKSILGFIHWFRDLLL